jgi:hypothetical protein
VPYAGGGGISSLLGGSNLPPPQLPGVSVAFGGASRGPNLSPVQAGGPLPPPPPSFLPGGSKLGHRSSLDNGGAMLLHSSVRVGVADSFGDLDVDSTQQSLLSVVAAASAVHK